MAAKAFYSFHHKLDHARAAAVRDLGVVEGNLPAEDIEWARITEAGDREITKWIAEQMRGKACVVVLVGAGTATRKWINHEISLGWNQGKGLLGIHIHNLMDMNEKPTRKGANPFDDVVLANAGRTLSSIVEVYDPPYATGKGVLKCIECNLRQWISKAIQVRDSFDESPEWEATVRQDGPSTP